MLDIIDSISATMASILLIPLLGTGIYLTIRLKFVQLAHFGHPWKVIAGIYDDPDHEGDINHFQALSAALSATVGIGNIAGVAVAIHYGGPGALFWMWVTAFLGMAMKFGEVTLAMNYRKIHEDGSASGGPMYYIEQGLGKNWKWLAVVFAVSTIISSFGSGNSVQAFTVADSFNSEWGIPPWITGLVTASIIALVILGGIRRIGLVASRLVPFMAAVYMISALIVIASNIQQIPAAFEMIFTSAFTPKGAVGGFFGSTFSMALLWGVRRGLFSNEAGQGSAPIAHAAAKTDQPVREGAVALIGPFLDTLLICTLTGLTIITTDVWHERFTQQYDLSQLTALSPAAEIGPEGRLMTEPEFPAGSYDIIDGRIYHMETGQPSRIVYLEDISTVEGVRFVQTHPELEEAVPIKQGSLKVGEAGVMQVFDPDGNAAENVLIEGEGLLNGSPLTAMAFQRGLWGRSGAYMVTVAVFLFAISTAISWSYYGDRATVYLFGRKYVRPYRILFCIMHFLGSTLALKTVWSLSDIAVAMMAFPNLVALLWLAPKIQSMKEGYFSIKHVPYKDRIKP
ncbi:amino acid carrier protein [bacterium]|nr:amino acid carrier protein [bacterium]